MSGLRTKAAVLFALLLGATCVGLVVVPRAAALPLLTRHGRWLTDPQGRVVILHGVQIDKYLPGQPVEGWIDLSAENVGFIAAQGFTAARVSMAYAGVEPALGHFDDAYVRRFVRFDRELAEAGVYDLLDMMQGQYSTVVGGDGFPDWMTITNGAPNNHLPFARGYLANPAENAAWDSFWANAPASDGTGLEDHYARGLHRIANAFARAPGLLALEILNEPWPGSRWPACFASVGCPAGGFDETSLTSFYRSAVPAIRSADPRHLIAYEPNLLFDFGNPTRLGAAHDRNLLFAFHDYCLQGAPGLPPSPSANSSCARAENTVLANADARARGDGGALLMDEWGNTTDFGQVEQIERDADRHMMGWAVWAYEDCCNSPAAIIKDGTRAPTVPGNLNVAELNMLVRPYPKLIAGVPRSWSYDPGSDAFTLTYSTRPAAGGRFPLNTDTEIELPALRYPTGYTIRVRGARVLSAPDANLLRLRNRPGAAIVEVSVTPARHHPGAPGPFVWPAGTHTIAPADCPPSSRQRVRLESRNRDVRILRTGVYVDGQLVASASGPAAERIVLPAGLADGSVVRVIVTTSNGTRVATPRVLSGCSLPRRAWTLQPAGTTRRARAGAPGSWASFRPRPRASALVDLHTVLMLA